MSASRAGPARRPSLVAILFCIFMATLWIAGGASRAAEAGQTVVRLVSTVVLIIALLAGPHPALRDLRPAWMILGASFLLIVLQCVPLPPAVWQSLPGRDIFAPAMPPGGAQPWRPLAIVPGAAYNAGFSLIVPLAILLLLSMATDQDRRLLPAALLVTITAGALLGLLQMSGSMFDNPLINETVGQASANFANRNHFALFIVLGCLLAPVWAFHDGRAATWRVGVGAGLILLFVLIVLGTGSRAGLGLCAIALVIGLVMARAGLRQLMKRLPRWVLPVAVAAFVVLIGLAVFASMSMDRAIGIERLRDVDLGQDMRGRGLPVVLAMTREYLPFGSGLGGFDPLFRMHEPLSLLKPTFFNHAHDDFLEIVLGAGIPGLLLVGVAVVWWGIESVRMWRATPSRRVVLARLGSSMLLLILLASAFDYPARTPMMMAVIVIAAAWLSWGREREGRSALPMGGRHL